MTESTTKRHLFNLGKLTPAQINIIQKVNNPDVISVIRQEWLENIGQFTMEQYTIDIVNYWQAIMNDNMKDGKLDINFTKARKDIEKFLRSLDKKYKLPRKPAGAIIIRYLRYMFDNDEISAQLLLTLMDLLTTKNRYHSGVLEIAIMTAPGDFSCKYDCYYCPNQPGIARSYIKEEPAVRRAAQHKFDCVKQIDQGSQDLQPTTRKYEIIN